MVEHKLLKQPVNWHNTIGAPIEEGIVELSLVDINGLIHKHLIPSPQHVQLLLYLVITPTEGLHNVPSPLSILYKLLDLHEPSTLAPLLPSVQLSGKGKSAAPLWISWEAHGKLERRMQRRMARCKDDGVWSLMWEAAPQDRKPLGLTDMLVDSDDDEDGENSVQTIVTEGWALLEWFTAFWTAEALSTSPQRSGHFLSQLGRPYGSDMARDDASAVMAIVRQAFCISYSASSTGSDEPTLAEAVRQRDVATKLLVLLIACATPPTPPFHQPSLELSFLSLFQAANPQNLSMVLQSLTSQAPWRAVARLIVLGIEDIANVRAERERRRRPVASTAASVHGGSKRSSRNSRATTTGTPASDAQGSEMDQDEEFERGPWPTPRVAFALDLATLHIAAPRTRGGRAADLKPLAAAKLVVLQTHLVMLLSQHCPDDPAWVRASDPIFLADVSDDVLLRAALSVAATECKRRESIATESGDGDGDGDESTVSQTCLEIA